MATLKFSSTIILLLLLLVLGALGGQQKTKVLPEKVFVESAQLYADKYEVTIDQFRTFVQETKYQTTADALQWSGVFNVKSNQWDLLAGKTVTPGNIWQGPFPFEDKGEDGFAYQVANIGQFEANDNQLHDVFGNVWEWTSTRTADGSLKLKGGSFLCDYNFCSGFIPAKYQTTSMDSGLNHLGMRCVYEQVKF